MHEQNKEGAQTAASRLPLFPDRIVTGLVRLCGALSTLLILWIFGQICVAVVRRYVFDAPLQWNDQMSGYLLVAVVMLGAAEALRRGDHIGIDLLTNRLSGARARAQAALAHLAVMVFAAVVGISIWDSIEFARRFGSYSIGYIEIQTWIPQLPVVLGAGLLFLTAALRLWRTLRPLP
ncbi:TRAP transporter small permease [Oceanicola sp. 502str15]|uniref:TRAP transporter small permease n=1 Tax=Oceanicola sp. 502str15 TaxID=2696061 RepID=UPI002095E401|nr:TRAP transporter small permease [Oceanicola sp. 502str15]MCO6383293.1 TRAP transporter small permease subunit [Oceanicola sp. 502str15]